MSEIADPLGGTRAARSARQGKRTDRIERAGVLWEATRKAAVEASGSSPAPAPSSFTIASAEIGWNLLDSQSWSR